MLGIDGVVLGISDGVVLGLRDGSVLGTSSIQADMCRRATFEGDSNIFATVKILIP